MSKSECINFWSVESSVYKLLSTDSWACIFSMDFWLKLEVSFRLLVTIGVWISVGTVGDISAVALTDKVSVVFFGANCWEEQRVLMSVSLNEDAGCWRELLDLLLSLWSFSFCCWVISVSLVPSVVLKTTIVLRLNDSRPLIDFLFIFCFIRFVMSAKASLVISEAVVLGMKSNIESTYGSLWLMSFKWSRVSSMFGLKWEILLLTFWHIDIQIWMDDCQVSKCHT